MNFTNGSSDKKQKNLEHRKKTVLFMKAPLDMHQRRWTRYIQDRKRHPKKQTMQNSVNQQTNSFLFGGLHYGYIE